MRFRDLMGLPCARSRPTRRPCLALCSAQPLRSLAAAEKAPRGSAGAGRSRFGRQPNVAPLRAAGASQAPLAHAGSLWCRRVELLPDQEQDLEQLELYPGMQAEVMSFDGKQHSAGLSRGASKRVLTGYRLEPWWVAAARWRSPSALPRRFERDSDWR